MVMRVVRLMHRWIGIGFCLMFAAWFLSGAVLIYHPFPSLPQSERDASHAFIDFSDIVQSPLNALMASEIEDPARLRLIDIAGQPSYIIDPEVGVSVSVSARDGRKIDFIDREVAGRQAIAFFDHSIMNIDGPLDYDQWIVHQRFDPYRPFYRVHFEDSEETVLYVSSRTGEVLQRTQGDERVWNYLGAIIHWMYPTMLRRHWALWDQVVWWGSFLGVVTTIIGLGLGVKHVRSFSSVARLNGYSPFSGWLRVHHLFGLFAGVLVLTWIVSGWLSMDHGRMFSIPEPDRSRMKAYWGISMKDAVKPLSVTSLRRLSDSHEVEFLAIGSQPFVLAKRQSGFQVYEVMTDDQLMKVELTKDILVNAVESAWPESHVVVSGKVEKGDSYGQLREGGLPENTLRLELDDPQQTWVHIDMETGVMISVMDQSRRIYRWLFNGLHSLDIPGFVEHRPLWDIVMLLFLTIGFTFSMTGVVIGWKRVCHDWAS